MKRRYGILLLVAAGIFFAPVFSAHASRLFFVSDTISDSRPAWPANHQIVFGVPSGVPAGGQIVVQFQGNPFSIDPSLSYTDADVAVSPSSPYTGFVERSIAATPDATDDGVAIDDVNGIITITLSSGSGIAPNSYVRLLFGTNAPTGVYQITNPTSTGSYRILLNTYSAVSAALDDGAAEVFILPAVGVDVNQNRTNPAVLSNGMPSGTIPSNISGVLLSLDTDVYATCRYATSSGVSYDSMTNIFSADSLGIFHTATVTSTFTNGTTYNFYVRCQDFAGNKNTSDYVISFTAGKPTGTGAGGGTSGGQAAAPGSGSGGYGGDEFPPGPTQPSLVLKGIAAPSASISVLQDGTLLPPGTTADTSGNFSVSIPSLPQGTYSFTLVENDGSGHEISSYTTTITIISATTNSVTNILLPPSVTLATSTIALNGTATISGIAEPSSTIEIWATSQDNLQNPIESTTTAGTNGAWSYSLSTAGFPEDTYQIKARADLLGFTASNFSSIAYLGVGTKPVPKGGNADLNGDGKVNLVDFSIMLFHWGQNYPPADLNGDGIVDLPDLSILLFHWTG